MINREELTKDVQKRAEILNQASKDGDTKTLTKINDYVNKVYDKYNIPTVTYKKRGSK